MSADSILTTLQTTLAGVQTTHRWETIPVDSTGVITASPPYFVHFIVAAQDAGEDFDEPMFLLDVQVDSWADDPAEAFTNLASAQTALQAIGWRMTSMTRLPVEAGQGYFGIAGQFTLEAAFTAAA